MAVGRSLALQPFKEVNPLLNFHISQIWRHRTQHGYHSIIAPWLVSGGQAPSATRLDSELHIGPVSDWFGDGDGGAGDSGHASGDRPSRWRRRWRWLAAPAVLATLAVVTSRSAGSRTSRQRPLQQSQQRDATTAAALAANVMVDSRRHVEPDLLLYGGEDAGRCVPLSGPYALDRRESS